MNLLKETKYRKALAFSTILSLLLTIGAWGQLTQPKNVKADYFTISKENLKDKIKGGWAGQTIGVTFGWPTEFVYQGTFIQDYQPIKWHPDYVTEAMRVFPGLFDDIYMDLTFMEVFERNGLSAPADSFAQAYAHRGYELWHANQAGRYNVLQGIPASKSGHWLNNPHADDIDFQIESDFAGLMSPAMPNASSEICDRVGHIMNYGDGWYGGVFISNMYANAFKSNDISYIVNESLKAIPARSQFYKCIADVIQWHKKYPQGWKQTWFEIQRKWSQEVGCPDGVFHPLDIDAKLNAAYVVLGLLYGAGDFTRTMQISTRAGQDSDCNPSSAGGILGTMIGYSKIPAYWLEPVRKAENDHFSFTNLSLHKVYELGLKHALENVQRHGGRVNGDMVEIVSEPVKPVLFEESFPQHYPKQRVPLSQVSHTGIKFTVEGVGFVLRGHSRKTSLQQPDAVVRAALWIDGAKIEEINLPTAYSQRRTELCWRYQLPPGKHQVEVKVLNPDPGYELVSVDYLEYADRPVSTKFD
ncbi:ADP-ribosylglycohydrolase family protein [Dyadobacter frigoris]|uniref:ADP-ribosylglycohydrolase family protein n=1 Tax=Dyadobacter frigoris TaxID=2576211 RepID=A0A4U6D4H6_9BACT|nr:ADP-ribosylglycohydrolase family protein [Dyadobacter frigoris]TKT92209.1 ADP-ribosylglycohydrolase family protein [Dyadobacter frigoris]GLU53380.1 hypothetical protein Dfri01_28410 [Dyadobacter frigoris]